MIIVGLTGGIATGKSTTAEMIRARGIPLYDADAAVHALMIPDGLAIVPVVAAFGPDILDSEGAIDRQRLGNLVFENPDRRFQLEKIIHPLVASARDKFLQEARSADKPMVVLDIPLLFEKGGEAGCDFVILCDTDIPTQRARALARPGMHEDKLDAILQSQMSLADKRARADALIDTGQGIEAARKALEFILDVQIPAWLAARDQGDSDA